MVILSIILLSVVVCIVLVMKAKWPEPTCPYRGDVNCHGNCSSCTIPTEKEVFLQVDKNE